MIAIIILILFVFFNLAAPSLSDAVQNENIESVMNRIEYEKQFALFVECLGQRESNNDWQVINQIDCMGKWQFAPGTLKYLGYGHITAQEFRHDPNIFPEAVQYQVLCALLKSNENSLKTYMYYIGQEMAGVTITKSGLLAAAHLGGCQSVKLFLLSMGRINKADCNQTSIKAYMKEFAGYMI